MEQQWLQQLQAAEKATAAKVASKAAIADYNIGFVCLFQSLYKVICYWFHRLFKDNFPTTQQTRGGRNKPQRRQVCSLLRFLSHPFFFLSPLLSSSSHLFFIFSSSSHLLKMFSPLSLPPYHLFYITLSFSALPLYLFLNPSYTSTTSLLLQLLSDLKGSNTWRIIEKVCALIKHLIK